MIYRSMNESSKKHQNDIDKLISQNKKEFDFENIIKNHQDNSKKYNEEMKRRDLVNKEQKRKIIQQSKLDDDNNND